MSEPNANSNYIEITKNAGKLDTLTERVDNLMREQKESQDALASSADRIADSVKTLTDKTGGDLRRLFKKSDIAGADITGLKARFNGAEKMADERNTTLHTKISEGFQGVEKLIAAQAQLATVGSANASKSAEKNWANFKWIILLLLGIATSVIGWYLSTNK